MWLTTDKMCLPCWSSANWWFHHLQVKSKFFWFLTPTFITILTSIKKESDACLTWLSVKILWTWHVLKLHENLKSKFFWFFTPTFTTILTSIKKEGVACLTWLSVRILWTWHVLKLHENLIISSSELNDIWKILISQLC